MSRDEPKRRMNKTNIYEVGVANYRAIKIPLGRYQHEREREEEEEAKRRQNIWTEE